VRGPASRARTSRMRSKPTQAYRRSFSAAESRTFAASAGSEPTEDAWEGIAQAIDHELRRDRGEDEAHDPPDDVNPGLSQNSGNRRGGKQSRGAAALTTPITANRLARCSKPRAFSVSTITVAMAPGPDSRAHREGSPPRLLSPRPRWLLPQSPGSRFAWLASSRGRPRRAGCRPRPGTRAA
jgi:hypothetical protein